jgi:Bacterial aa3 type cytochrome c oxidase subunit IV
VWHLDGTGDLGYESRVLRPIRAVEFHKTEASMSVDTTGGHPAMDYPEHNRTYVGFVRGAIILTVLVSLLLLGMLVTLV